MKVKPVCVFVAATSCDKGNNYNDYNDSDNRQRFANAID